MRQGRRQKQASDSAANHVQQRHTAEGQVYHIRIQGHLDASWSDWLEGSRIIHEDDGTTLLISPVADQAALHGLLAKIRDLGLQLLSANRDPGK